MNTQILPSTPENILSCVESLARGEIGAIPTETVYGLAAHVFHSGAVARIFSVKERPSFDPLIVHVGKEQNSLEALEKSEIINTSLISPKIRDLSEALIKRFWPGPLTLVLPKHEAIPDLVTSGLSTVAVRMPNHPVAQKLLMAGGFPLAAPSANRFGRISPTQSKDVMDELGGRIGWILDGGPCEVGVESTVVSFEKNELILLRPGGISKEQLEEVSKRPVLKSKTEPHSSPGMLESHYAPQKPLFLLPCPFYDLTDHQIQLLASPYPQIGLLLLEGDTKTVQSRLEGLLPSPAFIRVLSPTGNLIEAAQRLFSSLRELDASAATTLFSEPCPIRYGLGHAISDRLFRASGSR